jgi:enoyl-CoA hydratase
MSEAPVDYSLEDRVAVVRLDDGKANALSHVVLDALLESLDRAEQDGAKAIALIGRPGRFSAGFDLSVMKDGTPDDLVALVSKGASLALRIFDSPVPVVIGATGHALAMGAVLLLSADERIGAEGDFKLGLNEVAIAMALPRFALVLAEERLSRRHLYRATSAAEIYSPETAIDAGYLDSVAPAEQVGEAAVVRARQMGETLHPGAHRITKRALRATCLADLEASVKEVADTMGG